VTPDRRPLAGQTYAFPSGWFRIDSGGHTITSFGTSLRCAPATLPQLAIRSDGTFRLNRRVAGVAVELIGGFADPRGASLTLRFRSAGCDSGIRRLDAHPR
jgi:hypothetical protein